MSSGSSLVVPMVLWGPRPLTHCITSVYLLRDQRTLITGSADGPIVIWEVDCSTWSMTPRLLLVGHTSAVRCIAKATGGSDCHHIVTSADNGEMFTWDTVDGKCVENKLLDQVHTSLQAYRSPDTHIVKLYCCGLYEEILVMDPFSLVILFQLGSRIHSDWVSAFHVLRPQNRTDDVVLALTASGTVKVWTLSGDEEKLDGPVLENESKNIQCDCAVSMTCCVYNMRTVLVVCVHYWNIYDACDFTCLLSVSCHQAERWIGGEFISAERICVWSDAGTAYLYKLPTNCIVESKDFHNKSKMTSETGKSLVFCRFVLNQHTHEHLVDCTPAFKYLIFSKDGKWHKYLVRGDADGVLAVWKIPDTAECASMQLKIESTEDGSSDLLPAGLVSLEQVWSELSPSPPGVLNELEQQSSGPAITATIFLPSHCRLVCGRMDGSIVMVPATKTIMMHLLSGNQQNIIGCPTKQQLLLAHKRRISCLLYPHHEHPRYNVAHLVSGSVDFSVCLWDIYTGLLLHKFSSHGGEISSLHIPPATCSTRIQHCICSVATDHSVALLSLKERKCIMLAARHLFPVSVIKWKPLDDFIIIGCSDQSAYVWQMETGHLDRVITEPLSEELLSSAYEENTVTVDLNACSGTSPALRFFRGMRLKNLEAFKQTAKIGVAGCGNLKAVDPSRVIPLVVNGFKANPNDAESHILFFDVEALIIQLLLEQYSQLSPASLELKGLAHRQDNDEVLALTKASIESAPQVPEEVIKKVHRSAVQRGLVKGSANCLSVPPNELLQLEINLTMEVAQLLVSLLHAWGLDQELDFIASQMGLLKPKCPVSFGVMSRAGIMSLMMPTWNPGQNPHSQFQSHSCDNNNTHLDTSLFTSRGHWELSHTITTNHLLTVLAVSNTLLSISHLSFLSQKQSDCSVRQGWSRLSKLHGSLMSTKLKVHGSRAFKKPLVEDLAVRWQDRCLQIRQAAQELLITELRNLAPRGRRHLVDVWGAYLPKYGDAPFHGLPHPIATHGNGFCPEDAESEEEDDEEPNSAEEEVQRNQTTAVILLGVIGALFDLEAEKEGQGSESMALGPHLTRLTARALMFLVLSGSSASVSGNVANMVMAAAAVRRTAANNSLRRAAIDLIGRGFMLWEPHLDVSKILIGLLEMCCDADAWAPTVKYGLPLTPSADLCRTSRQALVQIAIARPGVFITSVAREIARYNNLVLNAQALNINLAHHVLIRSKSEILHLMEMLIEKDRTSLVDLLVDVVDIILHCVDQSHLKTKSLTDLCLHLCCFPQIAHCTETRRIAVGTKMGQLAIYELRAGKVQLIQAHAGGVIATAFSPDGKNLATYSAQDSKMNFWQTSVGMFGLGAAQTKCIKTYHVQPLAQSVHWTPLYSPKLVWISNRTIALVLPDGTENKFNC